MTSIPENYENIRARIVELLKATWSVGALNANSMMTAVYWDIGRRIVQLEKAGAVCANHAYELIKQLANDLRNPPPALVVAHAIFEYFSSENWPGI